MKREVQIGNVAIGGENPIAVQSMLNVNYRDVAGNVKQAVALESAGCNIIRVAVPNQDAVALVGAIKSAVSIPLVADIHFDYMLATASVKAGADKIRINPGNIGSPQNVKAVVDCCKAAGVPIRVGVNSGSVDKDLLAQHGPGWRSLVESAKRQVSLIEQFDFRDIVISVKSSDLGEMVQAYREIHTIYDYPLHLGVTEAGTVCSGMVKSSIGIGSLLLDNIGDTIRVSLTGDPVLEVAAAKDILRAVGKETGVEVISCPTCGRTEIDIEAIANEVEDATRNIEKNLKVAVMGCVVNGPGEAAGADIGIAGGKDSAILFKKGQVIEKIAGDYAKRLIEEIQKL